MRAMRTVLSILLLFKKLFTDAALARAGECEDVIGRQMVGAALLTAHLVALGEKSGMQPPEINSILKDIAAKSEIQEFWITELEWARLLVQYRNRFHLQPG